MTNGECSVRPSEKINASGVGGISAKVRGKGEEDDKDEDEDEEEIKNDKVTQAPIKVAKDPGAPTPEEVAEHDPTHLPYRSWCPECVRARGKATGHFKLGPEEKTVPGMHIDYWFMRDKAGGELIPVVSIKDDETKQVKAHVVIRKGSVEWVADEVIKDIGK